MALKQLLLSRKIAAKRTELEKLETRKAELDEQRSALAAREAELENAVNEITEETPEEERAEVDTAVDELEAQVAECETAQSENEEATVNLRNEIDGLQQELDELNRKASNPAPVENTQRSEDPVEIAEEIREERKGKPMKMTIRKMLQNAQERAQIFAREDVKAYMSEVRSAIREKRGLTNAGLLIPDVFLGILRENVMNYSKLLRHVNLQRIGGNGNLVVQGTAPEGVWTECCANLNELALDFANVEVGCFKVGGYFAVCNALLEDADIDLAATLLDAIDQAIGLALDKAILYGRNGDDAQKMPMGIVTRLVQTSKPAGYPATARPWVDLHTSNVKAIDNAVTGLSLFQGLTIDAGAAKGKYSRGEKVWVMNETTYTALKAEAMSINAAGAIVTGMEGTMPVIGGVVEVLDFVPDNIIIGGYFDLYLLAERAGNKFATSEHVKFLEDKTVMKGTARYDGAPAVAEGFVAIGIKGATVAANAVSFQPDDANAVKSIALNTSTATVAVSGKVQLFAIVGPGSGDIEWTSATTAKATVDENGVVTGVASGSSVITAACDGLTASCTVTVTAS